MNNKSGNQYSSFNSLMDGIKSQLGILIALLVMCVFLSIATNSFLATTNIFNVLRQIAVNVFLACGMTMVIILGGNRPVSGCSDCSFRMYMCIYDCKGWYQSIPCYFSRYCFGRSGRSD